MPFMNRVHYYPALSKDVPLRAALEEWMKGAVSRGGVWGLSMQRFTPEGAVFVIISRYPDLASWDKSIHANAEGTAAFQEKIASLLRQPGKQELFEVLIPLPAGAARGAGTFGLRVHYYPAIGDIQEVRALLEEREKSAPSRGMASGFAARRFAPDGPVFVIDIRYPDMAAYEAAAQRNAADTAAFGARIAPLLRQPNKLELFETLIPLPAA